MSEWTYIEGTVKILKEKKVSVKDVFFFFFSNKIVIDV